MRDCLSIFLFLLRKARGEKGKMNKLIFTIIFFIVASYSQGTLTDATTTGTTLTITHTGTCLEDVSCGICGKIMQKEVECNDGSWAWGLADIDDIIIFGYDYHDDDLTTIDVSKHIEVCSKCYRKYSSIFHNELSALWSTLLKDFRTENAGVREYYEGKKADSKILTDIQNQLNKIQKQVDKLK